MEHEFSICQENRTSLKAVFNMGHTSHGEMYKNCAVFEHNLYANFLKYYVGLWSKSEIVGFTKSHFLVAILSDDSPSHEWQLSVCFRVESSILGSQ